MTEVKEEITKKIEVTWKKIEVLNKDKNINNS